MANFKFDDDIVEHIKKEEGWSPEAYGDVTQESVGYGMNVKFARRYEPGKPYTEKLAELDLRDHLGNLDNELNRQVKAGEYTQDQKRVIYDMKYNLGGNAKTFFKKLKEGDSEGAGKAIALYNKQKKVDANRNPILGEDGKPVMEVSEGLTKRMRRRISAWNKSQAGALDFNTLEDGFLDATKTSPGAGTMPTIGKPRLAPPSFGDMERQFSQSQSATKSQSGLDIANLAHDPARAASDEEIAKLSRQTGMTPEEASGRLSQKTYDEVLVDLKTESVAKENNTLATWAQEPENFAVYKDDPNLLVEIENTALAIKNNKFLEDIGNASKNGLSDMETIVPLIAVHSGVMSKEKAAQYLSSLDAETRNRKKYHHQSQITAVVGSFEEMSDQTAESFRDINENFKLLSDDVEDTIDEQLDLLTDTAIQAGKSGFAMMEFAADAVKNWKGTGILASQSISQMAGPMAAGLAGTKLGAMTPVPFAAPVGGLLGSGSAGIIQGYGNGLKERMEKFRKADGTLDYNEYLNSSQYEADKEWAKNYGIAQGLIQAIGFSRVAKMFKTAKTAAKSGKAIDTLKTMSKGAVITSVEEYSEEVIPRLTAEGMEKGLEGLTPEFIAQTHAEGVMEGVIAVPMGGTIGGIAKIYNYVSKTINPTTTRQDTLRKSTKDKQEADNAYTSVDILQDMREKVSKSPTAKKYKTKVEEFLGVAINKRNEARKTKREQHDSNIFLNEEANIAPDKISTVSDDVAAVDLKENSEGDGVTVKIDELIPKILRSIGQDPDEFFSQFSDEVQEDYRNSKDTGADFSIPAEQWIMNTESNPEYDALVRINDNQFNFMEAQAVEEYMNTDPLVYFNGGENIQETVEEETPPPIPEEGQEGAEVEAIVDPLPSLPSEITTGEPDTESAERLAGTREDAKVKVKTKSVTVKGKFKSDSEREAYKRISSQVRSLVTKLAKGTEKKGTFSGAITPQEVPVIAEIIYKRVIHRSRILGKDPLELAEQFYLREMHQDEVTNMPGTVGFFSPIERDINWYIALRKDSSSATMMHELGHSWLYEMAQDWDFVHAIPENELTIEQIEYKFAMDYLKKRFKLDDFKIVADFSGENAPHRAEVTRVQETFAQTVEKFFMEGKFENSSMRAMLETFRKYFVNIARLFDRGVIKLGVGTAYKQYPAFEISPDVERVINGIVGMDNKIREVLYPKFNEPIIDPEVLGGKEGQAIIETIKKAQDQAVAKVYSEAYVRTIKQREKLIKEIRKEIEVRAALKVDELPSMKMRADLDARHKAGKEEGKEVRISHKSFLEVFFKGDEAEADAVKAELGTMYVAGKKKGGVDVVQIMADYEIGNIDAFLDMMLEGSRREELIDLESNAMFEEILPTLKSDDQISDIAAEAIQNTEKRKLLIKQRDIIYKDAKKQMLDIGKKMAMPISDTVKKLKKKDKEGFLNDARRVLLAQRVTPNKKKAALANITKDTRTKNIKVRINSKDILAKSDRLGKRAAIKYRQGNFVGAFNDVQNQAVYFEAFLMAKQGEKEIGRTFALIRRIERTSDKKLKNSYDMDMVYYMRLVLKGFKANRKDFPKFDPTNMLNKRYVNANQEAAINKALEDFQKEIGTGRITHMTYGAFDKFSTALRVMDAVGKNVKTLRIGNETIELDAAAGNIVESVGEKRESDPTHEETDFGAAKLSPLRALSELFPDMKTFLESPIGKAYSQFTNDSAALNSNFTEIEAGLNGLIKDAGKESAKDKEGMAAIIDPIIESIPFRVLDKYREDPILAPELGEGIVFDDISEIMMLLLYTGSESGRFRALTGGYKGKMLTTAEGILSEDSAAGIQKFINRLAKEGKINKHHIDLVNYIHKVFEDNYPQVKKAIRQTDGLVIGTVESSPIKTDVGTLTGGYFPLTGSTNIFLPTKMGDNNIFDVDGDNIFSDGFYANQDTRFTENRGMSGDPLNFDMGYVLPLIKRHLKVAHLRVSGNQIAKVLNHDAVQAAYENRRPGWIRNAILPWFNSVMDQEYSTRRDADNKAGQALDTLARKVRQAAYTKFFLTKIISPMKQYFGVANSAAIVGFNNMQRSMALTSRLSTERKEIVDFIIEKSPRMKERLVNHHRKVIASFSKLQTNTGWVRDLQDLTEWGTFALIQGAQSDVDIATWHAAFNQGVKEKGMDDKTAYNYADDVVVRSQGSNAIADTPKALKSTDLIKLFTMLSSVPLAINNETKLTFGQLKGKDAEAINAIMTRQVLLTMLIPSILSGLLYGVKRELLGKGRAKSKKKRTQENIKAAGWYAVGEVADNIFPFAGRHVIDYAAGTDVRLSPASAMVQSAGKARDLTHNLLTGVSVTPQEFAGLMDTMNFTGVGFSAFGELAKDLDNLGVFGKKSSRNRRRRRQLKRRNK